MWSFYVSSSEWHSGLKLEIAMKNVSDTRDIKLKKKKKKIHACAGNMKSVQFACFARSLRAFCYDFGHRLRKHTRARARAHTHTHTHTHTQLNRTCDSEASIASINHLHVLKKHSNNKTKAQLRQVCIVWSIFLDLWYVASDFCYLLPRNLQWFSRDYHEWASTTVFSVSAPNGYGGLRAIPSPFFAEFD